MEDLTPQQLQEKMLLDWDERALENPLYYVNTEQVEWTDEEFFTSGEHTLQEEVLTDLENICQGKDPRQMRVLEIGCGVGRVSRALAGYFGEVHGVDVSAEMIRLAERNLAGCPNAHVYRNNGCDLSVIPDLPFDFAFSCIVFQHIPSKQIIENYVRDAHRLLRPGGLFKFQIQGDLAIQRDPDDTWVGVAYSDEEVTALAQKTGFEARHRKGAGTQYFWLWFFKSAC